MSEPLSFELSRPGAEPPRLPAPGLSAAPSADVLPKEHLRVKPADLPRLSEAEIMRHYSRLASLSAWLRRLTPTRNCAAVTGRSAQIRTDVRSPLSDTSAWTGPAGSMSSENRARQTRFVASTSLPPPWRETSNCAIAVPCTVANGISKFHRGAVGSRRALAISTWPGSDATCNNVWRAIAASVSLMLSQGRAVGITAGAQSHLAT